MRRMTAVAAATAALVLLTTPATAVAATQTHTPALPTGSGAETGVVRSSATITPGSTLRNLRPTTLPSPTAAVPTANRSADTPQDEELKQQCESRDAALDETGWFRDRYTQCIRRTWIITIILAGAPVGTVTSRITMLGYGSDGSRTFRHVVYVEDIRKTGASSLVLETMQIHVNLVGCQPALVNCPALTGRDAPVSAWRLQNNWEASFTSPDVDGAGPQIVPQTLYLQLAASAPAQPNIVFDPPFTTSTSRERYDSADYVGKAKGAVFTDYRLVFEVDVNDPTQDESALHILHAQDWPEITFPSWVGKTVPGKTTPLTRMYNPTDRDKNRNKSVAMCKSIWGEYDGTIQNCDEYPFASTYEGSYTGAPNASDLQRYSVRVIDAGDNQHVGRDLLENGFYKLNRILDGDRFFVRVNT